MVRLARTSVSLAFVFYAALVGVAKCARCNFQCNEDSQPDKCNQNHVQFKNDDPLFCFNVTDGLAWGSFADQFSFETIPSEIDGKISVNFTIQSFRPVEIMRLRLENMNGYPDHKNVECLEVTWADAKARNVTITCDNLVASLNPDDTYTYGNLWSAISLQNSKYADQFLFSLLDQKGEDKALPGRWKPNIGIHVDHNKREIQVVFKRNSAFERNAFETYEIYACEKPKPKYCPGPNRCPPVECREINYENSMNGTLRINAIATVLPLDTPLQIAVQPKPRDTEVCLCGFGIVCSERCRMTYTMPFTIQGYRKFNQPEDLTMKIVAATIGGVIGLLFMAMALFLVRRKRREIIKRSRNRSPEGRDAEILNGIEEQPIYPDSENGSNEIVHVSIRASKEDDAIRKALKNYIQHVLKCEVIPLDTEITREPDHTLLVSGASPQWIPPSGISTTNNHHNELIVFCAGHKELYDRFSESGYTCFNLMEDFCKLVTKLNTNTCKINTREEEIYQQDVEDVVTDTKLRLYQAISGRESDSAIASCDSQNPSLCFELSSQAQNNPSNADMTVSNPERFMHSTRAQTMDADPTYGQSTHMSLPTMNERPALNSPRMEYYLEQSVTQQRFLPPKI